VTPTPLRLLVLGDSIAHGIGALRADDTLGRRLSRALTAEGFDVDLHVLAVPGAASADLVAQVRRAERLAGDVAVVVIGANDLARFVPVDQAAAALGLAVSGLRAAGVDVVAVPAPDMSSVPFVPPAFRPVVQAACVQLQRRQAAVVEAAGGSVAAVAAEVGRAFADDPAMFSADRFHPSSEGYARIAAALAPTVVAAAKERRDRDAAA
jgi:lysophospholipase L1-like esterase